MRLTPLNIALACVLVWAISEFGSEQDALFSLGGLLLLSLVLIAVDIAFRLWIRQTQRLWLMQIGFLLVVAIGTILIKIQF